jgi:DNA modification methylase
MDIKFRWLFEMCAQKNYNEEITRLFNSYSSDKEPITIDFRSMVSGIKNIDRATHLLHPYPAKLLLHIPHFFINNDILSSKDDFVMDPFAGSGTVLLEAILLKRNSIGADTNPLARLIATSKVTKLNKKKVEFYYQYIKSNLNSIDVFHRPDVVNIDYWFSESTIDQLCKLKTTIFSIEEVIYRNFFLVCLSCCVKRVSYADPRISVPVRLRENPYNKTHPLRKSIDARLASLENINVFDEFHKTYELNNNRMESFCKLATDGNWAIVPWDDVRHIELDNNELDKARSFDRGIQLIITSPPYPGAQKYIRSSSLSLGWLELCQKNELIDLKHQTIGREEVKIQDISALLTGIIVADEAIKNIYKISRTRATIVSDYLKEMECALSKMYDILNIGGFLVLVVGNSQISGMEFNTASYLDMIALGLGFTPKLKLVDAIRSRGLMTKRNKTASIISREWVLVYEK